MYFEIIGEIRNIEVLAEGDSIADLARHPLKVKLIESLFAGDLVDDAASVPTEDQ